MKKVFNPSAPIEPGVGMAGMPLRSHISEYFELVRYFSVRGDGLPPSRTGEALLHSPYHIAYQLPMGITMVFNVMNGRLYKLVADKRYQGALFGAIRTGMSLQDAAELEPRLSYDEDEEVWKILGVQGVAIDTDAWDRRIEAISVYVRELDEALGNVDKIDTFEKGLWS